MSEARGRKPMGVWPFAALGILAVVFVLMLVFSRKAPVITSLEPSMAAPGQEVVAHGEYFGRTEREGSLSLAGEIPPPSLIQFWSDQKIVFIVPADAASGLVTVSNSQGTSTGVLFTNTQSIPTVLQAAGAPGQPLLWSVSPPQPQAGQAVTLLGRGFGSGDEAVSLLISTGSGPVFELGARDCLSWSDKTVIFRVPAGAGAATTVRIKTVRGESPSLPLPVSGPVAFMDPRTVTADFRVSLPVSDGQSATLWGPVPEAATGTRWVLSQASPVPVGSYRPLVFSFSPAAAGTRQASYRLSLTTWARSWNGFPAGAAVSGDSPPGDEGPKVFWKPAAAALKALTSRWGLEVSDPWLRIQRIQTGLAAALTLEAGGPRTPARTPAQILASQRAGSDEASSLALALAAQGGISGRLVSGLWLGKDGRLVSRVWAEVWLAGAGWVPWDVVDGGPGTLDNRHFPFDLGTASPVRLVPRSETFGPLAPGTLGVPSGEATGAAAGPASWDVKVGS